jgi:hypothetical protein
MVTIFFFLFLHTYIHLLSPVTCLYSLLYLSSLKSTTVTAMEALLTHSFDYLSSYEPNKIRKGLRQVEGLLAQICLSRSKQTAAEKRRSMIPLGQAPPAPKALNELADDPAFREFFKLQEGFQWNGKSLDTMAQKLPSEGLIDRI